MFIRNRMFSIFYSPDAAPGGGPEGGDASPSAGEATPEGSSAQPEGDAAAGAAAKPEKQKRASPPTPTREADDSAYARIVAKAGKNPNYEMTDAEAAIFERVSEREPGEEPPNPKAKAKDEPDPGDVGDEADVEKDEPEGDDDLDPDDEPADDEVPDALGEFVGEKSPFGAKTVKELPGKLKEFAAKFKEMQGRDGLAGRLEQRISKQTAFIQNFMAGTPEAIAFAVEKLGYKPANAPAPASQKPGQQQQAGKPKPVFLDDDMAAYVAELEGKVGQAEQRLQKIESRYQVTAEQDATREAQDAVINEMSVMTEKYPELAIKVGSLRELAKEYMTDPKLDKVDPRFKNMAEILHIAAEQELPSLEAAFAVWRLKSLPQTVAQAERRGRESLAKNTPSRGLSDRQGSQGGQYTAYSDADIKAMAAGQLPIPDDWHDADGNLIMAKLPKRLRDQYQSEMNEVDG